MTILRTISTSSKSRSSSKASESLGAVPSTAGCLALGRWPYPTADAGRRRRSVTTCQKLGSRYGFGCNANIALSALGSLLVDGFSQGVATGLMSRCTIGARVNRAENAMAIAEVTGAKTGALCRYMWSGALPRNTRNVRRNNPSDGGLFRVFRGGDAGAIRSWRNRMKSYRIKWVQATAGSALGEWEAKLWRELF